MKQALRVLKIIGSEETGIGGLEKIFVSIDTVLKNKRKVLKPRKKALKILEMMEVGK
jgi:hypothetical protein